MLYGSESAHHNRFKRDCLRITASSYVFNFCAFSSLGGLEPDPTKADICCHPFSPSTATLSGLSTKHSCAICG